MTELLERRPRSLHELCLHLEALGLVENAGDHRYQVTERGKAFCHRDGWSEVFAAEKVGFYFDFETTRPLLPGAQRTAEDTLN